MSSNLRFYVGWMVILFFSVLPCLKAHTYLSSQLLLFHALLREYVFVPSQAWGLKENIQANVSLRYIYVRLGDRRYQAGLTSRGVTCNSCLKQPHIWWMFSKSHIAGNRILFMHGSFPIMTIILAWNKTDCGKAVTEIQKCWHLEKIMTSDFYLN